MIKRIVLFLLLASVSPHIYSQTNGEIFLSLNKISTDKSSSSKALDISKNWKFQSGDSLRWVQPTYNDENWQIKGTMIYQDSIPTSENTGLFSFRLKILTDSSLFNKSLGLIITQNGASEIYLDGKLVHKFGKVGSSLNQEKDYNPAKVPIVLNFDSSKVHILAIRYSYQHILSLYKKYGEIASAAGMQISIGLLNESILAQHKNVLENTALNLSLFGIVVSLALLHLFLYFFYKTRITNLYYSLFSFSLALNFLLGFLLSNTSNPATIVIIRIISILTLVFIFLFFLAFIYSIDKQKPPKIFKIFVLYFIFISLIPVFVNFISHKILNFSIYIFAIIILLESVRILIKAIIKRVEGSWIIGFGGITFILALLFSFSVEIFHLSNVIPDETMTLIMYLGIASLPIFMSIYLARDFAGTNRNLSQKLVEVNDLLQKTIEQEKREAEVAIEREKEKARLRETELQTIALEAENDRKAKELEEARKIQLAMLPKKLPNLPQLDIAVYMETATEVGGDYYDFHLSDDGTLTAILGDATGHGVKAGVMVTAIKSMFISNHLQDDIPLMFHHFSKSINELNLEYMYMCLAVLKINDYKMRLSSAGIPPFLIYRKSQNFVEYITMKGMPLGTKTSYPYEESEIMLAPGDAILVMSDGYPELFNENNEMFGYNKIIDVFRETVNNTPEGIIDSLKESIDNWKGNTPTRDDITFVVIKVK